MTDPGRDEFYVGYLDRSPPGIASRTRLAVVLALIGAAAIGLLLVNAQRPFARSRFEFGVVREFRGVVLEHPHPVLLMPRPGDTSGAQPFSQVPLTGAFKFGAGPEVSGLDGEAVRLEGSLIHRDGRSMIKLERGSVVRLEPGTLGADTDLRPARLEFGEQTLSGEIVDSMCWLGLMKPGAAKPHRACAARCISGGAPPVLLVRHRSGAPTYYLLVSRDGGALNREILDVIAEPVEIGGRVVRDGDMLLLYADRSDIRRL